MKCFVSVFRVSGCEALGVDEKKQTVRDEAAKVPAHNAVPGGTLAFVELSLEMLVG